MNLTALSLIFAGLTLRLLAGCSAASSLHAVMRSGSLLVGRLGFAALSRHLFSWHQRIDELLLTDAPHNKV